MVKQNWEFCRILDESNLKVSNLFNRMLNATLACSHFVYNWKLVNRYQKLSVAYI